MTSESQIELWKNLPAILASAAAVIAALGSWANHQKLSTIDQKADAAVDLTEKGNRAIEVVHQAVNTGSERAVEAVQNAAEVAARGVSR